MSSPAERRAAKRLSGESKVLEASEVMDVAASYPEIERAGGLLEALSEAVTAIPCVINVMLKRDQASERYFSISNALHEHIFLTSLWDRGVELFRGSHAEIGDVALVVADWLGGSLDIESLCRKFPELEVMPWSRAYGESAESFAIACWEVLVARLRSEDDPLARFASLGACSPELRRFRPFTSMGTLLLSRTAGYPFLSMGISVRAGLNGTVIAAIGSDLPRTDHAEMIVPLIEREISHIPSLRYGTEESGGQEGI